jgi:hypothetical protein
LGLTVSGAAVSLNDSSNFNSSINGGNSAGSITLGNTAAGAINLTTNAASVFAFKPNTATAFKITDQTNSYLTLNTQTATKNVSALTLATGAAPTIASAADAYFNSTTFTPGTVNYSGSTQITGTGTGANNAILFNQPTINRTAAASSLTIDQASNLFINGPVIASHATGGQTETITSAAALRIGAGASVAGTNGAVTTAYGLYVDPPTGAGTNYAAYFNGPTNIQGTVTTNLTASRFVTSDASSNLTTTGTSAFLLNTLSDETGTGVAVFGTSPAITTSLTTGFQFI